MLLTPGDQTTFIFVSCNRICTIEATKTVGTLLRLPVVSEKGSHKLTNVRYGEVHTYV